MAVASILRRASSAVVPIALRALRTQTSFYHRAILAPSSSRRLAQEFSRRIPSSWSCFSSAATKGEDERLLEVIQSEIKCAEESDYHDLKDEVPETFPFEIQDHPGEQTISLKRQYDDELITVNVHMPDLVTGEERDDGGDDDTDTERPSQSALTLVVNIAKGDGPCLEFCCSAYPDEVTIDSMSVKEQETSEEQLAYEGPDFSDLDENLQKAFHKYLELRGIKASTTNFLHEYMINKDSREYLNWLKNLKKFIEK
ncbi:unnamed protein product [Victoria cruziana]